MKKIQNPEQFGRVAVLMGGTSSEREVSLNSGANVLEALLSQGINAFAVDGVQALLLLLNEHKVDRVFNILHGNKGGGEDGVLQGLLEAYGIPYTGSNVLGSSLSMDKIRSKQIWLSMGLPTPRYVRLEPGADVVAAAHQLGLPIIVKPSCEGSSVGISRVFKEQDLTAAIELANAYPGELLMEQMVVGQEFTVAILGETVLPSIRIVPAGEYYDYHAKYIADDTQYLCPGLQEEQEQTIAKLALSAFQALGCRGWGRVDVMRDQNGKFYLLEVNTAPGMTSHSLVPKAAQQVGIDFPSVCWLVLETSMQEDKA
ncbi:MAG: D-alanine--D-alanine ligase [Arenimonas sp.]|nr:D-alanine--D-alanine ligase [Arenimonas sp.]